MELEMSGLDPDGVREVSDDIHEERVAKRRKLGKGEGDEARLSDTAFKRLDALCTKGRKRTVMAGDMIELVAAEDDECEEEFSPQALPRLARVAQIYVPGLVMSDGCACCADLPEAEVDDGVAPERVGSRTSRLVGGIVAAAAAALVIAPLATLSDAAGIATVSESNF